MYTLTLSFLAGILLLMTFRHVPEFYAFYYLLPALLMLIWRKSALIRYWVISLTMISLGFGYAAWSANQLQDRYLPEAYEGKEIIVTGTVSDIPKAYSSSTQKQASTHFFLNVHENNVTPDFQGNIKLAWYKDSPLIKPGETWQLKVKLKRPNGFLNPGIFDYEKWLFRKKIVAVGYVRTSTSNQQLIADRKVSIDAYRASIYQKIKRIQGEQDATAVLGALTVAIKNDISDELWNLFRSTGTNHLMAISGLHIGMVATFAYMLIKLIWFIFPSLALVTPRQQAGVFTGVVFAFLYALLAGFTIPTQRAFIMVAAIAFALLYRRHFSMPQVFSVALLAILLIDPFSVLDAGFWLSFIAVALIFYLIAQNKNESRWVSIIRVQLLISLAMIPLTTFLFGSASWLSPIANIIAIPWVTLLVVPFALLGVAVQEISPVAAALGFDISLWAIDVLIIFLKLLTALPESTLFLSKPPLLFIILSIIGVLWLFAPKGIPAKWLGLLLMMPVFIYKPAEPVKGAFEYVLLDTGQSLASVIKTQNHTLVYDTGYGSPNGFNIGEKVVVPYLNAQGIHRIDHLIVSHLDNDHSGGVEAILEQVNVSTLSASEIPKQVKRKVDLCRSGQAWQWDGVHFTLLSPVEGHSYKKRNNRSCVLKVENKYHSLLLTADIEKEAEKVLLKQKNKQISSEILLIPHHGSKTSSTISFLRAVNPSLAIVNAGYRNRYHFPTQTIRERYQSLGIPILNTASEGAIRILFPADDATFQLNTERSNNAHFWNR
jgi:competence protein ComEC